MFLIFFLIFILLFTVFQNILIAGIVLVLAGVFLVLYQAVRGKKIRKRELFCALFGGFILAGIAFVYKEWRYYGISDQGRGTRTVSQFPGSNSLFVGSGMISDISGQGKYVFSQGKNEYLLYSEKEYMIDDQIWLVGEFTPPTPSKMEVRDYWKISSSTFAVPIFSGVFDYPKRLKMKGWKGTIYEKNSILITSFPHSTTSFPGKRESSLLSVDSRFRGNNVHTEEEGNDVEYNNSLGIIQSMKKSIQERVVQTYGKNKVSGLILGMLIGDKSQIPEEEYQHFIDSGLVHLVAVSGGNILMIVVFLQFALFFLPFYVRIGVILATIIGYSFICGMDSSVFRAMLMGGMSMVALFRGREIVIRRLLSISAIVMLLINPYFLAYDTGFLLSYSAIIGLVYFDTITRDKGKGTREKGNKLQKGVQYVYKNYISPSIGASIGIFPIIIFFMGQINLVSILGNLLVLPIVPFVMIYGFISIWIYMLLDRSFLLWIEQFLINYIYKISDLLATYGVFLKVSGLWVKYLLLVIFFGIFVFWRYGSRD